MKTLKLLFVFLAVVMLTGSCKKDDTELQPETQDNKLTVTQKVNIFIKDVMSDVYLWADKLPDIDEKAEKDPKKYFEKLLYSEDKWSFITDDVKSLENSFQGIEKSYGWSLIFRRFSDSDNIFAVVEFVYPGTPAAEAGIKRGDVIFKISDEYITDDTYLTLLNGNSITVTIATYNGERLVLSGTESLTAKELNLNPVVFTKIIEHAGHKIGYLFYAQFISKYNSSLDTAIQHFLNEEVTDLVLDLRYNPGGTTSAAQHLCSSLAPVDVVDKERTLVTFRWNEKYQAYWEKNNVNQQLKINFDPNVAQKMDLRNLYVITGHGTASASELSITGLKPYMNVTTIGETTYGKYTASITLKPKDIYDNSLYYDEFSNWGLQPIVLRYANSQGVTDFKNGFAPDIEIEDNVFDPIPLGNKEELLLSTTLKEITGVEVMATVQKSAVKKLDSKIIDRGFSIFDRNKRELLFDNNKFDFKK